MNTKSLGKQGEDIAAKYLCAHGYRILSRNFHVSIGEVDIIAWDEDVLVFIEVKTRRSDRCGTPGQSVHHRKQQKIARTADWYLHQHHMEQTPCRFDVIEVYLRSDHTWKIRQISGAFESGNSR